MLTSAIGHNPDVLTCLANLSSDEVFTPPELANQMLDLLPEEIWSDPTATFLDPACKSGVFLREIARRLNEGLAEVIPDQQDRVDYILKNQVFGIAITELTGLLGRRSLYCSKLANGKYSVSLFDTSDGNIRFDRVEHEWKKGKCAFCGASESEYDRSDELESHAYQFIHTRTPEELFGMRFDVIISNPPYQLSDGGFGRSASPIYQKFVEQAKRMEPRYLTMIIPSRWFAGGKGLDEFRKQMLNDDCIRQIVDFEDAREAFPGVDLAGGVNYFLWDRDHPGPCEVVNIQGDRAASTVRSLNEFPVFIRYGEAIPIIHKVMGRAEPRMNDLVSSSKPFGLRTFARPQESGDILLRWERGTGPYMRDEIATGVEMIDKWKVITSYVGYDHAGSPGRDGKRRVFSKIDVLPPGTICTETYLVVGSFDAEVEAQNLVAYMKTSFFRFLVSQFMYSHHITKDSYSYVPRLDMSVRWTDEALYSRYDIADEEIAFIESKIKPMDSTGG